VHEFWKTDEELTVSGTVTYSDNVPAKDVCVEAVDQDLRCRQELGTASTDSVGHYEIRYTRRKFARAQKGGADLVMRVVKAEEDDDGEEKDVVLFETAFDDILFNAPVSATIDISLTAPSRPVLPEFQSILNDIQPLFECSGIESPASLREDTKYRDVTFLSKETGWDPDKITDLAVAFRLCDLTATQVKDVKVISSAYNPNCPSEPTTWLPGEFNLLFSMYPGVCIN